MRTVAYVHASIVKGTVPVCASIPHRAKAGQALHVQMSWACLSKLSATMLWLPWLSQKRCTPPMGQACLGVLIGSMILHEQCSLGE